ncbi:MAG: SDR family oxidoreductase [Rhodospirillaceae bacterium]|nr:SDR family oxidoreductase [Rhodospirillaceae bacterium]MBT6137143.1 SDR family oxidoreductase [Rhodospirillaceae bacterium]
MGERLAGKVAMVMGAGSIGEGWGNGKATAVAFAREGATVIAVDVNEAAALETVAIIKQEGNQAEAQTLDVTKSAETARLVTDIAARHGRIDVLHNNVGIGAMGGPIELSEEDWHRVLDVNLTSVFLTCKHVLPVMLAQGKGAIVNVSSVAAIRNTGYPYSAYYASKGGLNQFTVGLALEYASQGVRANVIMPGLMNTPHIYQHISGQYDTAEQMVAERDAMSPTGKMGTAWDVAWAAVFLASDEANYITGHCLPVDGGLTMRT